MFLDSASHMDAGSRRRCCGCWCGRDHGLGCPVGMSGSGMGMLLGSRTATPRVIVARFDAHAWRPVLGGWSDRVARGGLRTG